MSSYLLNLKGIDTSLIHDGGEDRTRTLDIIDDFLHVNTFDYFYERWYSSSGSEVFSKSDIEKLYNPYNYMGKIIDELVLLSPQLNSFNTSYNNKIKVLNRFLKRINWSTLLPQIFRTLETKGDFFLYWYYDEDNKIQINVIDPKEIKDIALSRNRTKAKSYSFSRTYIDESMNNNTGTITGRHPYEVVTVFKEGRVIVNDPLKYESGSKIITNKDWEQDKIRIVHVPSNKNVNEKFSRIPAVNYIDPVLLLDNITTDLRMINKLLGFPIRFLVDGKVDSDNSHWGVGGFVNIDSQSPTQQAKLITHEISNSLDTVKFERDLVNKDLYKKAGLIREELEESMSSGGSSRVMAQIRLTLENKFEKYCKNIADAFAPLFESVLKNNDAWAQRDERVTFELPETFINTSIFDELQITNSKLALGQTTIQEELRDKGFSEDRMKQFIKEIQEERALGTDDVDIAKETVSTAVNGKSSLTDTTDNQFKQDSNI